MNNSLLTEITELGLQGIAEEIEALRAALQTPTIVWTGNVGINPRHVAWVERAVLPDGEKVVVHMSDGDKIYLSPDAAENIGLVPKQNRSEP